MTPTSHPHVATKSHIRASSTILRQAYGPNATSRNSCENQGRLFPSSVLIPQGRRASPESLGATHVRSGDLPNRAAPVSPPRRAERSRPMTGFVVRGIVDGRPSVARWQEGGLDAEPELLRRAEI